MVTLAVNTNARTRLLCLVEIMTMYSDEQNILSIEEICGYLQDYGFEAVKRNVLSDIKAINTTPIKIISVSKPKKGYYIAKSFSQEAISLILESVFSSELLTDDDVEYIKKYLRRCACLPTLDLVFNTTVNLNQLPSTRKKLNNALNSLRHAIKDRRQALIRVSYAVLGDSFSEERKTETLVINPIVLAVANGTVVLVFTRTETPKKPEYIHISRIEEADLIDNDSTEFTDNISSATNYFGCTPTKMILSEKEWLLLRTKTEDINLIENRFHFPVQFRKDENENYCIAKVLTVIDYSLVGWLFTFGDKIEILSPPILKELFEEKAKNIK